MVERPFSVDLFRRCFENDLKVSLSVLKGDDSAEYHFVSLPSKGAAGTTTSHIYTTMYRSNVPNLLKLQKVRYDVNELVYHLTMPLYHNATIVNMKVYPKEWDPCFDGPPDLTSVANLVGAADSQGLANLESNKMITVQRWL